ncbi:MAG TPA: PKD domain-containing protein [Thermoanaerobaculia bacterium]|nr:PKD domain-containing protein [Thermoanaerobaculia bacterium]
MGKKSVGYQGAIGTFVGRYNDSGLDSEGFSLPRPLRAWQMRYDSVHDRLYMRVGSFVVGYDVTRLISRLQAGESLVTIDRPGDVGPAGSYLNWDKNFNIEDNWPQSGMDGGDWLPDFDFDDRGLLWLTEGVAWGNIKDDYQTGNFQDGYHFSAPAGGSARSIVTLKTSDGRYWVGVSPETGTTAMYDVSDRANPIPGAVQQRAFIKTSAAKTADSHWIAIVNAGTNSVEIFTAEDFVFGRGPTFAVPGGRTFKGITTDGSNFYAAEALNGKLSISKFTPTGGTFTESTTPTSHSFLPERIKYGSGYISVSGLNPSNSTNDIYVFRAGNGSMTELDLNAYTSSASLKTDRYFPSYYSTNGVPAGFLSTIYSLIFDSLVIQKNGHTYLIVNAKGFGDIYEIKGSDSITAQNKGITGTANPNSAQTGNGPYYGDKVVFGSTTSAPAAVNVNWNFGNPESTDNSNASVTGRDVIHQFAGLTSASQLSGQRTVSVTSASDSSIFDQQFVTLAVPAARAGIVGQPILFTQPNASSTAAIVTSDQWKDASDGTIEGHFASWNIDAGTTKALPNATVPVGACGTHSLIFTANYGPYAGSGSTLASTNGTLAQSINPINYQSRPFVAIVNGPSPNPSDANKVMFTNASRATANTADLPANATFTFQWDLLNSGGSSLQSSTGTAALNAIPAFNVDKSTFSGVTGAKVRLLLTTTAALGANCSGASSGTTGPLSAPDPVISVVSGCQYSGAPCNLSVTSASGADTSAWNVSWSFNPTAGIAGGTGLTFSPSFSTTYSGSVLVSVSNAIGGGNASKSLSISTAPCNVIPTAGDFVAQWFGTSTNCYSPSGTCTNGEQITFSVTTITYHWNNACDSYLWTFGDGQTAQGRNVSHTYPNGTATYTGKFELTVGSTVLSFPFTVKIGSNTGGGGGGGCGNNCPTCPQITADSAFASYSGGTSGCTYVNSNFPCQTGESLQFSAVANFYSGYNFNCGSHSFSWNFGDGQSASGQNVAHTYAAPGNYSAQATVNSPTGTMIYTVAVPVGGGAVCTTPSASNVALTLSGNTSGCSASNPSCRAGENVAFGVSGVGGYSFSACEHNFSWDFGDGSNPATGQTINHTFSGSQSSYTVHVTVSNQSGSTTLTKVVNFAAGSCAVPTADLIFLTYSAPSGCSVYSSNVACSAHEVVAFQANPNTFNRYNFNCGTHTFAWDFGDSGTATGVNPSHTFVAGGTYNVKCVVTNTSGSVTLPLTITVAGGPGGGGGTVVGFAYEAVVNNPTLIMFTPSVVPANSVTSWKWNFGDGSQEVSLTGTSAIPQYHAYATPGTYTVTLTTNAGVVTKQVLVGTTPRPRPSRH